MERNRIESGTALVEGYDLHFLTAGRGPPLVLVASMLVLARSYTPLIRVLARSFRVCVVEMPGSGRSSRVVRPLSMEEHAKLLLKFLDHERIQRAVLIGHSNSGPVALLLSRLAPERVEQLVLVDSVGVVPRDNLARVIVARGWDGLLEAGLSLTGWHHLVWNMVRHPRSFWHQVRQSARVDLRDEAHEVAVPTLLAWGKRDHTIPRKYGSLFRWHLDRSRFAVGPGSHDWLITRPKAFASTLHQTLADPLMQLPRYDQSMAGIVRAVLNRAQVSETELLRGIVGALSVTFGERHVLDDTHHRRLRRASEFIGDFFEAVGLTAERQSYLVRKRSTENVIAEIAGEGRPDEIVVIGAHYDTVKRSPGANDNGSGVALLLALARRFASGEIAPPVRTIRFVAFSTEEPPFTRTPEMGSWRYAQRCREQGEYIVGMLSLETLGTQASDAVTAVANRDSAMLGEVLGRSFRTNDGLRAKVFTAKRFLRGANSSDHWSFWQHGYPAVMLTDGGPLRYRHYHRASDTVEQVDFMRLRRVLDALAAAVSALVWRSASARHEAAEARTQRMAEALSESGRL